jgi:hypothetical protein
MKRLSTKVVHLPLPLISIAILLGVAACGDREPRRIEKRDEATHVFTGQVKARNEKIQKDVALYDVEIAVESVEKGEGLKPGERVRVFCYMALPGAPPRKKSKNILSIDPLLGSYSGMPQENERIRVYARKGTEGYIGIYPDWCDVLKAD